MEVNGLVREAEEDLDMAGMTSQYIPPIRRIVRDTIREDYIKFYPKPEYSYEFMELDQPNGNPHYEKGKHPGKHICNMRELAQGSERRSQVFHWCLCLGAEVSVNALLSLWPLTAARRVALAEEEDSPQQECHANNGQCHDREVDYLIVGAGGGGIKTALLLKRYGYSFRVLEKEDTAASFWTKLPALQDLILVTQKVQNETQFFPYD